MICKPCLDGGKFNQGHPNLQALAYAMHLKCKGGSQCDCQHVVGRTAKAGREAK